MRRDAFRIVFKVVPANDGAGTFEAYPRPCHPRVTVRVDKIDLAVCENVPVIGAARDQNQRANGDKLEREQNATLHSAVLIRNQHSEITI